MQMEKLEILRDGSLQLSRFLPDGSESKESLVGIIKEGPTGLYFDWTTQLSDNFRTQLVVVSPWAKITGARCRVDGMPVCAQDAQDATQVKYSASGEAKQMKVDIELDKYNLLVWPTPTQEAGVVSRVGGAISGGSTIGGLLGVFFVSVLVCLLVMGLLKIKGKKKTKK